MSAGFVRIARFPTSFLAHLVAGRLESEGIPAFAVDDTVEGSPAGTMLFVPAESAARAVEALARTGTGAEDSGADDDGGDAATAAVPRGPAASRSLRCPSCGSDEVEEDMRVLPFVPAKRRCVRCRTVVTPRDARA